MTKKMEQIEASKLRMRRKLASLPVLEKLRMLDALRARTLTLKSTRPLQDKPRRDS